MSMRGSHPISSCAAADAERVFDRTCQTPATRRHLRVGAFALILVVMLAIPFDCSAARWYEDFEKAVDLIKDGECSREALQLLGAAVVDKKKPKLNARTIAVKTVDYLPYFQLARAHMACGEFDSARHYIEISRDFGVAPSQLLDSIESQLDEIEAQTRAAARPEIDTEELKGLVDKAAEKIREAVSASDRVALKRESDGFAEFFAENQGRLDEASRDLSAAQQRLSDGTLKRDSSAIAGATETALRSLQTFTDVEAELARLQPVRPTPRTVTARATPRATPTSAVSSRPTTVIAAPSPSPTARPVVTPPTGAVSRPRGVPESLRRAAADYLAAGYDEVIQGLQPSEYRSVEQQAAAYLLRAAAHFAIYCLGGREDEERMGQVRWDISLLNNLDPSLRPDPRFFSPEFIELVGSSD
jgi:hypothetical protein